MRTRADRAFVRRRMLWLVAIFVSFWLVVCVGVAKVWIKAQILGLTSVELSRIFFSIENERMKTNKLVAQRARLLDPRRLEEEAKRLGMVLPEAEESGE